MPTDPPTPRRSSAFDALGDPTRRHLLELLAAGEQPVGALVEALRSRGSISQPAVSQHLKVLFEAGLVTVRAEGTRRLYALDREGVARAVAWLDELSDPGASLTGPLDALATEVARGRRVRRTAPGRTAPDPSASGRGVAGGRSA